MYVCACKAKARFDKKKQTDLDKNSREVVTTLKKQVIRKFRDLVLGRVKSEAAHLQPLRSILLKRTAQWWVASDHVVFVSSRGGCGCR